VRLVASALLLLTALASPLAAQDEALLRKLGIPVKAAGWVTDIAGVLDAGTRTELEQLAERYRTGSGHDVAVLIIPTLDGLTIEKVGLEVFRTWKLGRVEEDDGALLLIATNDRELRIEVGRGLEGDLTDLVSGRIIRGVIVPHFKNADLAGGVRAGVIAIHAAAGGDYGELPVSRAADHTLAPLVAIGVILFIVAIIVLVARLSRSGGGGRRRKSVFPFPIVFPGGFGGGFGGGGLGGFGGGLGGFGGGGGFGGVGGFGGGGGAIGGGASGKW
jgi:uncharacterized protein